MNSNPSAAMSNFDTKDQYSARNYKALRKFDDDYMWSMSWDELENKFEPKHEVSFNEQAHIRRREEERKNTNVLNSKGLNSARRLGNRISPLRKDALTNPGEEQDREWWHSWKRNRGSSLTSSITARSSRTPGRHISREQFRQEIQHSRPRKRGVGHERSTFGGRRGIVSWKFQRRGLRGFRNKI